MTEFSLRNVWIVAKREYRARVRTRSFLLSTFATPILMGSFMMLPTIIAGSTMSGVMHDTSKPVRIVLASDNRALAELARGELVRAGRGRYTVTTVSPANETERARLTKRLNASDLGGYVWLDGPARTGLDFPYEPRHDLSCKHAAAQTPGASRVHRTHSAGDRHWHPPRRRL